MCGSTAHSYAGLGFSLYLSSIVKVTLMLVTILLHVLVYMVRVLYLEFKLAFLCVLDVHVVMQ